MSHFGVGDPRPNPSEWRFFRKTKPVEMVKMDEPFTCSNREVQNARGRPGDYIAEDGYGGYYVVGAEFHSVNYEQVPDYED